MVGIVGVVVGLVGGPVHGIAVLEVDARIMDRMRRAGADVDLVQLLDGNRGFRLGIDGEDGLGKVSAHAGDVGGAGIGLGVGRRGGSEQTQGEGAGDH